MKDKLAKETKGVTSGIEQPVIKMPSDEEIWKWWKEQKFQRVRGEQDYIMIYEIDLPKILKSFTEHFLTGCETK